MFHCLWNNQSFTLHLFLRLLPGPSTQCINFFKIPVWAQKTFHKKCTAEWTPAPLRSLVVGGCTCKLWLSVSISPIKLGSLILMQMKLS